jgi:peptidoglycan/LPS O-acetylase OafA/YrhL
MHYRSDIDGLRAVAIIPVVLFHLGFTSFSGGYVGVDVFFVISGFLITSLIYGEMCAGSFSFIAFYERRVRRLLPALFAVIVASSTVAAVLMLPNDLKAFSQSLVAATVFGANVYFQKTAGYFDGPTETKPLLHTWSLSVEEQFYIFYPILLLIVLRYFRSHVRWVVSGGALLSLVAAIYFVQRQPNAVFYLLHFRAWELLLGALLALGVVPGVPSTRLRDGISLLGLGMIGYSVFAFSRETVFPAANALYPSVGAALVLYSRIGGPTLVGRLLGLRPLVLTGLVSYSLYLWHWPLIVFSKYYLIRNLTLVEKLSLLVIAFLLAAISWRYIERPFRGKSGLLSGPAIFKSSAAIVAVLIAIGLAGKYGNGFPQRFSAEVARLATTGEDHRQLKLSKRCMVRSNDKPLTTKACHLGTGDRPSFLLWGDSHALALAPAVDRVASKAGRMGLFVGKPACPPLLGVKRFNALGVSDDSCRDFYNQALSLLEQNRDIRTVILVGRWALSSLGHRFENETGAPAVISPEGIEGNPKAFHDGLERTLRHLNERGLEVIFVTQVPEVAWQVPSVLARASLFGREIPSGPSLDGYRKRQRVVSSSLDELSGRYRFRVIDIARVLCPGQTCLVQQDGLSLYRDDDHLSSYGAAVVSSVFEDML